MQHLRGCLPGRRKQHFQELLDVGWLEVSADGSVSVHDWDDWQSQPPEDPTRKKRQSDYRETHREELAEKERARRGDVATVRGDGVATPRGDVQTETETETETDTEKKRREEKERSHPPAEGTAAPFALSPSSTKAKEKYPTKADVRAVYLCWLKHAGFTEESRRLTPGRTAKIKTRLREWEAKVGVEALCQVIERYFTHDDWDWHREQGLCDLEKHILKSEARIEEILYGKEGKAHG